LEAFIKHITNDHSICDDNCKYKNSNLIMPKNKILDLKIKKNQIILEKIKKIYQTKIKESHMFSYSQNTNLNESFHHSLLSECPKGVDFYKSYNDKICVSILKKNWGKYYLLQLFSELNLNINYFCFQKLIDIENKKIIKNFSNNSKKIKYENKIKKNKKINIIKNKNNKNSYPSTNNEKIKNNNLTIEYNNKIGQEKEEKIELIENNEKIKTNEKKIELIENHEKINTNEKKIKLVKIHKKQIIIHKQLKKRKINKI
jgi:hypothetical protein